MEKLLPNEISSDLYSYLRKNNKMKNFDFMVYGDIFKAMRKDIFDEIKRIEKLYELDLSYSIFKTEKSKGYTDKHYQ